MSVSSINKYNEYLTLIRNASMLDFLNFEEGDDRLYVNIPEGTVCAEEKLVLKINPYAIPRLYNLFFDYMDTLENHCYAAKFMIHEDILFIIYLDGNKDFDEQNNSIRELLSRELLSCCDKFVPRNSVSKTPTYVWIGYSFEADTQCEPFYLPV